MNLLRTDLQTALQSLHVSLQESADNLRDLAEFVDDGDVAALFIKLAEVRNTLVDRLAQAIREVDDLPAAPNSEKEAGEHLVHHVRAMFSADQAANVIQQCLEGEAQLAETLKECDALNPGEPYPHWRQQVSDHIADSRTQLEECLKTHQP